MEYADVQAIALALLLGFMIGMQRSLARMATRKPVDAGSRTFALIALLGYLSAWLSGTVTGLIYVTLAMMGLLMGLFYFFKVSLSKKMGMTTQVAAIITFLLGVMVYEGLAHYAIFLAVTIVAILEIKPRLRAFESRLSATDINAAILLLVMTFIVLPVLPDKMMGSYALFNPYKTWLMAVIIAGISFVGYAAIKLLGQRYGVLITGAAGGLVSSTAVTVSLAKRSLGAPVHTDSYAAGIAIASTLMLIRMLFVTAIFNPDLTLAMLPAYATASAAGMLFSLFYAHRAKRTETTPQTSAALDNPLQLSEALKFGLLFGIVYGAITLTRAHLGTGGIYLVAFFTGITDVDAITLSLTEISRDGTLENTVAMYGITIAAVANSLFKLGITFWMGGGQLGWKMAQFFTLVLATLGGALYFGQLV